jgi:hypothetical protein
VNSVTFEFRKRREASFLQKGNQQLVATFLFRDKGKTLPSDNTRIYLLVNLDDFDTGDVA